MSNITPNFKIKTFILGLATMACSFAVTAQEAGTFPLKKLSVVVPVDAGGGVSTILKGKAVKKAISSNEYKKHFKQNSNNTLEFRTNFTGITEEGEFGNDQGKYSSSEFIEVYGKKGSNSYWPNTGSHVMKARMKAYKVNGIGTTYISRIVSVDKSGSEFDKIRIMWRDGYILAEVRESYNGGIRYKRTKVAEVGENMFNFTLRMASGNVSLSIDCKNTGANKKNVPVAKLGKTANSKNLFRIGNYYKNDKNSDDSITVQIKYLVLTHK